MKGDYKKNEQTEWSQERVHFGIATSETQSALISATKVAIIDKK